MTGRFGEVQEWLNWPLSKSGEPQGSEGSNPSLSAKKRGYMAKEDIQTTQSADDNSLGIVSMVLGIASLVGGGLMLGIPAIIIAVVALKKKRAGRNFSITGLITGIISTAFSLLTVVFVVFWVILGLAGQFDAPQPLNQPQQSQDEKQPPFLRSRT